MPSETQTIKLPTHADTDATLPERRNIVLRLLIRRTDHD